ncbi:MAG: 4Fe-4S binding protein [Coriobacteriales bacterium]|jgi:pyruvate ferredoxin oxidoreductase delta subunit|nr:4Fe-4S binding protein [Coriobacteriales bacterium]
MSSKQFTWDVSDFDTWTAERFPKGCVAIEAGNSELYITGGWRSERPVWQKDKCKNCMFCWVHCPDSSILVADAEMIGIDYDHCKGCGICVAECPFDALHMVPEGDEVTDEIAAKEA